MNTNQGKQDPLTENFSRLSLNGKKYLKGFLQDLVCLQNSLSKPDSGEELSGTTLYPRESQDEMGKEADSH
jgi:hypothetical protein